MLHILGFAVISVTLLGFSSTQDANCDYYTNVQAGSQYYVYSPGYPNNYPPGVQCRWIAVCPSGYNCKIECGDINLPQTASCSGDRLLVSRSGDPALTGADKYCGRGTLTATSTAQRLSIGLISTTNSKGGRFLCNLMAQPVVPPTTCSCGYKKTNRIVGGQETGVNEFPMMAGLVDLRISHIYCGAVIIHAHYVLTAAHCLTNRKITDLAVVVGEHNVNTGDSVATQSYRVAEFIEHLQYNNNSNNYDFDIAILRTSSDIQFSDRVGPACLPFKFVGNGLTGAKVTALGWGTEFPGGPTSAYLQKVDLDVIDQNSCRSQVPSLTDRQLCTYTREKDACQDDSGGPLLYADPTNGLLYNVAIISYGKFCASKTPGINTRVTTLLDWIRSVTPDANYCRQ